MKALSRLFENTKYMFFANATTEFDNDNCV